MIVTDTKAGVAHADRATEPVRASSRSQFVRVLAYTLLVPAFIYVLTFVVALSPRLGLRSLGLSKFGPVLDYGYEARHVDADVLIFGDSSAFLGVDPRLVNRTLNIRSAVLPNTVGSLPIAGDLVLRRYLEHNRPPHTLVLYFSPWDLNYDAPGKKEFLLEGEEEILRYGSWKDVWHAFTRYPAQFLVFPFQTLEPLGLKHIRGALQHQGADRGPETAKALGHLDFTFVPLALENGCQLRPEFTKSIPHDTVRNLRDRFQREGTQVVVYLAPIPNCSNSRPVLENSYSDLNAAPPALLPPDWFANDSFGAHVLPGHVQENSRLFAETLQKSLAKR